MKSKKIIMVVVLLSVLVLGTVSVYAANNFENKINTLATLTGKTAEQIATKIESEDKTFCQIAYEERVLDEFTNYRQNTGLQCDGTGMKNEQGRHHQKMLNESNCQNMNCMRSNCIYQ